MAEIHPRRKWRYVWISIFLICVVCLVAFAFLLQNNPTRIIGQGEQDNGLGTTYGYLLENYLNSDGMRLTIWVKMGSHYTMKSVYDLPSLTVDEIVQKQWIKSSGAVYLDLQITYHDSIKETLPTKIIYDFHRGEMHISSELTLWRIWSERLGTDGWVTENEFSDILSELQK